MSRRLRDKARNHHTWFQLYEIYLGDKLQVAWLFRYLPLLREGLWPQDTDCESGGSRVPAFRAPVEVSIEIDKRIEKAGIDGALVEAFYSCNRSYTSLATQFHLNWEVVRRKIRRGLMYISDNQAHKMNQSYSHWRELRRG